MENEFKNLIGSTVEVELSGKNMITGVLVDSGLDIVVVYNSIKGQFLYIPIIHIQRMKETVIEESLFHTDPPSVQPIESDQLSFRNILTTAKGLFVQVYVTGNKPIHGYLTSIMNDYFVFHSPVYKILYISMKHVKWLIPYPFNTNPYSLTDDKLLLTRPNVTLARSFEEQFKKFENQIVILDGGDNPEKIGLLKKVSNQKLILITAEGETLYRNLEHIKTLQVP